MKSLWLLVSVAFVGCSLTSEPQIHYVTRAEIADVVRSGRVTAAFFNHSGDVNVTTDDGHVYRSVSRPGDTTDIGLRHAPNRRKITIITE